jgi:parallel beta-helix repeat protein
MSASPTVRNCSFENNEGGGIYCGDEGSEPLIDACTFRGHSWSAISCCGSSPTITNCLIMDNESSENGAGICLARTDATIVNCTIVNNTAAHGAGGMYCTDGAASVANCILRGNSPSQMSGGGMAVTYCNVQGGCAGEGNIDADPRFVDPDNHNFRIGPPSPCIDAGDSTAPPPDVLTDLDGNPRFVDDPETEDTGIGHPCVDMGAYEYQGPECPADFDGDGDVDTSDLLHLLGAWGTPAGDVDGDGDTDTSDLLALLAAWGECP